MDKVLIPMTPTDKKVTLQYATPNTEPRISQLANASWIFLLVMIPWSFFSVLISQYREPPPGPWLETGLNILSKFLPWLLFQDPIRS